jgi:UDP-N-acetylglucosamine:LPS N-acetylglucosamine transferase
MTPLSTSEAHGCFDASAARVVTSGGGFGGHVSMAIAIGQALRIAGVESIDYIGCRDFIEHRMVTKRLIFYSTRSGSVRSPDAVRPTASTCLRHPPAAAAPPRR